MFGVVLWSSSEAETAIIWCEDHKDLAVLCLSKHQRCGRAQPVAGDLLRFDTYEENGVRKAVNAINVANSHCQGLEDALKAAVPDAQPAPEATQTVSPCAEIVPFPGKLRLQEAAATDCKVRTGTDR